MVNILLIIFNFWLNQAFAAEPNRYTVSFKAISLAPNAGGQEAYSLLLAKGQWEGQIFRNHYLMAGDAPLMGGTIAARLPMCGQSCWWQFYTSFGVGFATTGPIAEITWSSFFPLLPIWLPITPPRFLPSLRLDLTSQFLFFQKRHITWSYPLWAGLAISF